MSNIQQAFQRDEKCLITFFTAGDPSLDKTVDFVLAAERGGAGIVELGIPFSDPMAEGPVIQDANIRALRAGATVDKIFNTVVQIRKKSKIPLVFLTYINPVFHYGVERFMETCKETGIDGIIIPDLPFEEREEVSESCEKNGIDLIPLVAPTSGERIQRIVKDAKGFIYCVSSMGVTGVRECFSGNLSETASLIKESSSVPTAIGFGIKTPEQVRSVKGYADGVIVGSAVVSIVEAHGAEADEYIYSYVKKLKEAL